MSRSARELSDLIGAVYEAGLDPTGAGWPALLGRLSPVVAGGGPLVLWLERHRIRYAYVHQPVGDPDSMGLDRTYRGRLDPAIEPRRPSTAPGELLFGDALIPGRAPPGPALDADLLPPHDVGAGLATVLLRQGSTVAGLYAARPRGSGGFPSADVRTLRLLLPHLAASVRASFRLVALDAARRAAAQALDHVREAVILVDGAARVHAANRAAERLLRGGDGIALEPSPVGAHGRLQAATPAATLALRRAIAATSLLAAPAGGDAPVPAELLALALERPSGLAALSALVAPLRHARAGAAWGAALATDAPHASAAVFVSDPEDPEAAGDRAATEGRLRAAYRLTPAEAAVALALARGLGLPAAAAAHGVALATVRTQAQHVYRKTGVRGQAALARLVERLAHVRRPSHGPSTRP